MERNKKIFWIIVIIILILILFKYGDIHFQLPSFEINPIAPSSSPSVGGGLGHV